MEQKSDIKKVAVRKWISKKTGETVVKEYDNKKYYDTWYAKNKDNMNVKTICETCGGSYSKSNRTIHMKTKKHIQSLSIKNI